MSSWEIERVEKMTEEEQRAYYGNLVKRYKEQIKELKGQERRNNVSAIASIGWRVAMLAGAIAAFAGPALTALGSGAIKIIGEITTISSVPLFGASMFGMLSSDDDGPKDININFLAAKETRASIKELEGKIKEINKKPVMGKR